MPNSLDDLKSVSALAKVLALMAMFTVLVHARLTSDFQGSIDMFHQGEFFGNYWHMLGYFHGREAFPVLIHGAMDYWPSLVGGWLYGHGTVIFGTRLIVVLVTLSSWGVFVLTGIDIAGRQDRNHLGSLAFVALFCLTLPFSELTVTSIEESPVGLRDLFLILQLGFLARFYLAKERNRLHLSLVFFLWPLTLCWSYDRGVAATLACLALLAWFAIRRQRANLIVSLSAWLVSAAVFELIKPAGSIAENVSNILYWAGASGEVCGTSLGWGKPGLLGALPLLFVAAFFAWLLDVVRRSGRAVVPGGLLVFVVAAELVLLKSAYNRPGLHRGLMAVWPLVFPLLWAMKPPVVATWQGGGARGDSGVWASRLAGLAVGSLLAAVLLYSVPRVRLVALEESIQSPPSDLSFARSELAGIAGVLGGGHCSLNMVNQGVFTLLSRTCHCTRFPYLLYATRAMQPSLIARLRVSDVKAILIESHDWSSNVDGRSMQSRFPELYAFLAREYPCRLVVGSYVIVSKPAGG
jgi:hypothetical protein